MAAEELKCRECGVTYALEARYVCDRCFGPLEVSYAHPRPDDPRVTRRRIQGGPQNICLYAQFIPRAAPPAPTVRSSWRLGRPAGCTPLVKADRLAERLGLDEVWVKNDAHNPTHSFKDRVLSVPAAPAPHGGFGAL